MRKFKTESKKLLDLMINSIYTNREIFLRELISNASDAVDKLYFRSLTDQNIQLSKDELEIRVAFDEDTRTITVSDSGIGMTEAELEKNLGTIAHSGSQEFKAENDFEGTDAADIIGQFGVGFYSSFMVAKNVKVVTRAYGSDEAFQWESNGIDGYTIAPAEKEGHGTDVILTLKDNTDEDDYDQYLREYTLRGLIRQYSNYVRYPIHMTVSKTRPLPKPEDAGDDYVQQYEDYTEDEVINSMIPIWKRRKSEVTDEEYAEFYKSDFHDFQDPQRTISVHAEGALSYDALMFIPSLPPFDLYSRDYEKGLALYSAGVLIMDKCADLLPDYYNFVRGVVDSSDLTLNISRETLQRNSQLRAIANKVEKKITGELEKMRDNDRDDYELFWDNFGRSIKFGIYQSYGSKADELGPLLMFYSAGQQKYVTLDEYVEGMPEEQGDIYYAAGESVERLRNLPIVKTIRAKGYDVLLCTEDVDEFALQVMRTWKEHDLKNVSTSDIDLASDDEKKVAEEATEANKDLFAAMQEVLGENVSKIEVSPTSMDAPARLTAVGQMSMEMERILSQGPEGTMARAEKVLQLNAEHHAFETLKAAFEADDKSKLRLYTDLLYNQALLVEGLPIEDPLTFAEEI
ncbi:MAG: molecular chaperone HtpG, partial [Eggerthellaceae bacterium]|nr:molecular chaperone HtpG [Eggerthellaceae bacterium]